MVDLTIAYDLGNTLSNDTCYNIVSLEHGQ